jgi:hypothetical protein
MTGGWLAGTHDIFLRVFKDFKQKATPEFFDRLKVLLPDIPRITVAEHVKWFVDYEHHKMKLRHTTEKQREGNLASRSAMSDGGDKTLPKTLTDQLGSSRRLRFYETKRVEGRREEFHDYANEECRRWGLKHRSGPRNGFAPVQHHVDGGVADDTLRAHPQFKKSPGYTWSAAGELRDNHVKRFTSLSEVRSGTHMTNPGPGHYLGIDEQDRIMERRPACTIPRDGAQFYPYFARPDYAIAFHNAEVERRLTRVGVKTNGEIMVSLMWESAEALELNIVPPVGKFGKPGSTPINRSNPKLFGGTFDVSQANDPGQSGGKNNAVESISWPRFLGADPPPVGEYKVYVSTQGPLSADVPWVCRLKIGERKQWYGGVVKSEVVEGTAVCTFKYDGPLDSATKIQKDLHATQLRKPSCLFGKEDARVQNCSAEGNALSDKTSTLDVNGPGRYRHATALASHF